MSKELIAFITGVLTGLLFVLLLAVVLVLTNTSVKETTLVKTGYGYYSPTTKKFELKICKEWYPVTFETKK